MSLDTPSTPPPKVNSGDQSPPTKASSGFGRIWSSIRRSGSGSGSGSRQRGDCGGVDRPRRHPATSTTTAATSSVTTCQPPVVPDSDPLLEQWTTYRLRSSTDSVDRLVEDVVRMSESFEFPDPSAFIPRFDRLSAHNRHWRNEALMWIHQVCVRQHLSPSVCEQAAWLMDTYLMRQAETGGGERAANMDVEDLGLLSAACVLRACQECHESCESVAPSPVAMTMSRNHWSEEALIRDLSNQSGAERLHDMNRNLWITVGGRMPCETALCLVMRILHLCRVSGDVRFPLYELALYTWSLHLVPRSGSPRRPWLMALVVLSLHTTVLSDVDAVRFHDVWTRLGGPTDVDDRSMARSRRFLESVQARAVTACVQ